MKKIAFLVFLCLALFNSASVKSQEKKTDWAKFNRYAEANAKLTKAPTVIFYGNSITDFWIEEDKAFFASNNLTDRGVSGQTSSEMLVRFRQDVIDLHPKLVVIMAGTNDVAENNGPITLQNALGNIISMCELAKVNNIKVILCSVLPCNNFAWKPEMKPAQKIIKLNSMIKAYANNNGITYVDYHTPMATKDGALKPEYTKDGCHPTLAGYKIMEPIVLKAIKATLK